MMIRSPIKWAGGKSKLRKQIIAMMPLHDCYVEVFAGAAWVLFAKTPSSVEVLNDIDGDLINFFRVIKSSPEEFLASFDWALASREEFERLRHLDTSNMTPIERAHRFYYLIMAGWGGELNLPRFQTSITDGGHGNRLIGALKTLRQRIMPVYERLQTVIIEKLEWQECINRYDKQNAFLYLDPPYPGNHVNYQFNLREWDEHVKLAERVKQTKAKWLLTTYDQEHLRNLFADFYVLPVEFAAGMPGKNGRQNNELIITNYDPGMSWT